MARTPVPPPPAPAVKAPAPEPEAAPETKPLVTHQTAVEAEMAHGRIVVAKFKDRHAEEMEHGRKLLAAHAERQARLRGE